MPDPSRVPVSGPLESIAVGFARWLVQQSYTPLSATFQLHFMAHVSRWLTAERLDTRELGTADIERFLKARRRSRPTQHLTAKAMRPMLTFLRSGDTRISWTVGSSGRGRFRPWPIWRESLPSYRGHFSIGFNIGMTETQMRSLIFFLEAKVGKKQTDNANEILSKVLSSRAK